MYNSYLFTLYANTTDVYMYMYVYLVNQKFSQAEWYSKEINKQLQGRDWEKVMLDSVDLSIYVQ